MYVETPQNSNIGYTHVLQKSGVLKNFSVAKIVSKQQVDDLKQLIRAVAKDDKEYEAMLAQEMAIIANMHDLTNPIPGIIYFESAKSVQALRMFAREFVIRMKVGKLSKQEIRFILAMIIKELGIAREDFLGTDEDPESENDDTEKA
jgi:cell division protein FtsB